MEVLGNLNFDTRPTVDNEEIEESSLSQVGTSTTLVQGNESLVEQTASGITTTLWTSPSLNDRTRIANYGGGENTIDGNGTNIMGLSSVTIKNNEVFSLYYNGTEWKIG